MAFHMLIIGARLLLSELKRKMSKRSEFLVLVLIFCSLACLDVSESCTVEGVGSLPVDDDCGSYKDLTDSLWGNSLIQSGIDELCQNSRLFSFPSTLNGLITEEHNSQAINLDVNRDSVEGVLSGIGNRNSSWSEDFGLFELSNGRTVSCSLHSGEVIDQEFSFSCENEGRFKNDEMKLPQPLDGSYPCVQISHYQLTWGQINLYHPSVTSLSIKNTCSEISLIVYEPFSTELQFYPCNFTEVQLGPGESVSLCLVFLPTKLGLSSAQFIVQTSSGGYLVQAKGFGVESPYKIMPMTEFDVSSSGWRKSVSLFNPFDEAIELEEMIAWVSVFVGSSSHSAKAICREEGVNTSSSHRPGFLNAKKWLDVRTGYGFPTMTLRPLSNWLIGPQGTGGIMDINFQPNFDGKILGTVCLQLRRLLLNKTETLLIPLEGEPTYNDDSDLVVASIETAGIYEATRSVVFSVSVTNSWIWCLLKLSFIAILVGGIYVFLYHGGAPNPTYSEEENSATDVHSSTQVVEPSTSATVNQTVQIGGGDKENIFHSQREGKAVLDSISNNSTDSDEDVQSQRGTGIDSRGQSKKMSRSRKSRKRRRKRNQSGACTIIALDINPISASESVTVENSDEHVQSPAQVGKPVTSDIVNQTVQTRRDKARNSDEENAIPIAKDAPDTSCMDRGQREEKVVMVAKSDVQTQRVNPTGASNTITALTPSTFSLTPSSVNSLANHQGPQSSSFIPSGSRVDSRSYVAPRRSLPYRNDNGVSTSISHQQQTQAQPRNSDNVAGPSISNGHLQAQSDNVGARRRTYRDALLIRDRTEKRTTSSSSNRKDKSPVPIPRVRNSSTSTIAPRLQAPGSNLDNRARQADETPTYRLWGDHIFFDRMNRADNSNRDFTFHMGDPRTIVKNSESSSGYK